jgi:D-glycero-alpha-D-manno-heptose 1-phosphate guanylyltransferase
VQAQAPDQAVILAGGLGTRIRHLLQGRPKPLAEVAGRPFLEWVIRYLAGQGLRRIVLSAGYAGEQIEAFARSFELPGVQVDTVIEPQPLGTAGGFLYAWQARAGDARNALVLNGDSLALVPLAPLFSAAADAPCAGALLAVEVEDASRYGTLVADETGRLQAFAEKRPVTEPGPVNAGVYLLSRAAIASIPVAQSPLSFETQVFPDLLARGERLQVVPARGAFLDIGTEASLARADAFIRDNLQWFPSSLPDRPT